MKEKKIAVIGASGMLGSMIVDYLSRQPDCAVVAVVRDEEFLRRAEKVMPEVKWCLGSADYVSHSFNYEPIFDCSWIVNAVGITKPLIRDDNPLEAERAIFVNSLLPHYLGRLAQDKNIRVLQIATDCVYSGRKGQYLEEDPHDCEDVYGKSKSLGETWSPSVGHLRCSIIGPELKDHKFLLDWFTHQSQGAVVKGFTNHKWNGVTTLQFAKICYGIMRENLSLSHMQHVVPAGDIKKSEMLAVFARCFNREDIVIEETEASTVVDRTLRTLNPGKNIEIWRAAGYESIPSVEEMIEELGQFEKRIV